MTGSAYGDADIRVFSLNGKLGPLWPPPPPSELAGPTGPVAGCRPINLGDNNVEYAYWPARTRVKAGTSSYLHQMSATFRTQPRT